MSPVPNMPEAPLAPPEPNGTGSWGSFTAPATPAPNPSRTPQAEGSDAFFLPAPAAQNDSGPWARSATPPPAMEGGSAGSLAESGALEDAMRELRDEVRALRESMQGLRERLHSMGETGVR